MRVGGYATLDSLGNLGGMSTAKAQRILAKEDISFNDAISSLAAKVLATTNNPSS